MYIWISLSRRVGLEKQELRDEDVRDVVVDLGAEEDDAVHEQAREDVVGALAARRALDDVGNVKRRHGVPQRRVRLIVERGGERAREVARGFSE